MGIADVRNFYSTMLTTAAEDARKLASDQTFKDPQYAMSCHNRAETIRALHTEMLTWEHTRFARDALTAEADRLAKLGKRLSDEARQVNEGMPRYAVLGVALGYLDVADLYNHWANHNIYVKPSEL